MSLSGDILQASDDLSQVINSYKRIVEGQPINGEDALPTAAHSEDGERCFIIIYLMFVHFMIVAAVICPPLVARQTPQTR